MAQVKTKRPRVAGVALKAVLTPGSAKVRASRLRNKKAALTVEENQWLSAYQAKTATARFPDRTAPLSSSVDMRPIGATFSVTRKTAPTPAEPQRRAAAPALNSSVQKTVPPTGNYAAATWIPVAPVEIVDGVATKPQPIIAEAEDTSALDAAALKMGGALAFLVAGGLAAAEDLAKRGKLAIANDLVKASIDDTSKAKLVAYVGAAGARVARKYSVGLAFAYEDEATVALAVFGSAFLIFAVRKADEEQATPTLSPREQQEIPQTNIKVKAGDVLSHAFGVKP